MMRRRADDGGGRKWCGVMKEKVDVVRKRCYYEEVTNQERDLDWERRLIVS